MGGKAVLVLFPTEKSAKILKWKVNEGTLVNIGRIILLYDTHTTNGQVEPKKLKATHVGTVRKLLAKEGDIVQPGSAILELEECMHPTVFKDMCAECGLDLRKEEQNNPNASVPMVHSIPELKVSEEQAQILGKADESRLLQHRKLVLLVDLDQTLIHTTNDNIPANLKDVYHFQLYGSVSPWYHTRLRPGTHKFLSQMSDFYELHICTFGARNYAHMIAMFLDPDGKFFSHRILSRDECFDPNSKTANLKALFPCGDNMVCIIDDREDVWNYASNLIHVKPYHFFQHTGDINAPPGLDKHESDDKEGFDFTNLGGDKATPKMKKVRRRRASNLSAIEESGQEKTTTKEARTEGDDLDFAAKHIDSAEKDIDSGAKDIDSDAKDIDSDTKDIDSDAKDIDSDAKDVDSATKDIGSATNDDNIGDKLGVLDIVSPNQNVDTCIVKTEIRTENNKAAPDHSTHEIKSEVEIAKQNDNISSTQTEMNTTDSDRVDVVTDLSSNCQQSVVTNISSINTNITIPSPVSLGDVDKLAVDKDSKTVTEHDMETNKSDEELVEVEDCDDYLMYLEEILKMIHKTFFEHYEELQPANIPDLKQVIPEVRSKVLAGVRMVFSGLVPTHVPLEQSRAYLVARSLGAHVTQDLEPTTTHLVAVRTGTAKVNAARRFKGIIKVTPNWLWCCAERWERVEEKLFPLGQNGAAYRHPPAHCASPEHVTSSHGQPATRRRTPSGRFMDSINPLMSFSMEDIANMDKEVEDIFNESDESDGGDDEEKGKEKLEETLVFVRRDGEDCIDEESCADDMDSLSDEDTTYGWSGTKRGPDDSDEEMPSVKFRRGEALPSDAEDQDESQGSVEPPDEQDDGDWNMMGAALEREFLSGDARD